MAQRIEALRTEKGLSRPALSAALGLPKLAAEKFETGRQTPTQAQQKQLADFFGVSVFYLRGESSDRTRMDDWMTAVPDDAPAPAPRRQEKGPSGETGGVFGSFLSSPQFQQALRSAVLDALRSREGQELLANLIRRQLDDRRQAGSASSSS